MRHRLQGQCRKEPMLRFLIEAVFNIVIYLFQFKLKRFQMSTLCWSFYLIEVPF